MKVKLIFQQCNWFYPNILHYFNFIHLVLYDMLSLLFSYATSSAKLLLYTAKCKYFIWISPKPKPRCLEYTITNASTIQTFNSDTLPSLRHILVYKFIIPQHWIWRSKKCVKLLFYSLGIIILSGDTSEIDPSVEWKTLDRNHETSPNYVTA